MKILLSPQMRENEKIIYEFEEGIVRATYKGKTDVFDFRDFSEGELDLDDGFGGFLVETDLDYQPIRQAKKENGVLYVKLMNFIGLNATPEECFPDWIDHEEYKAEKSPDSKGEQGVTDV